MLLWFSWTISVCSDIGFAERELFRQYKNGIVTLILIIIILLKTISLLLDVTQEIIIFRDNSQSDLPGVKGHLEDFKQFNSI